VTVMTTDGSRAGSITHTFQVTPATVTQATLEWDPNSETDLAGYKLYYGQASGSYDTTIDVGNQTTYTLTDLPVGETYYIAATAYNTSGLESGYSNEVIFDASS
jgi:fibronectin type 3 domain-containing protein